MSEKWYTIRYETRVWEKKDIPYLSRQAKSKIVSTYESSLPDKIADKHIVLSPELDTIISDLMINITRFDMIQQQKGFGFPNLLLRSESAASSQIEHLTSSIRNIAMAELNNKAPKNAQLIAANVLAMHEALNCSEAFSIDSIVTIHKTLMAGKNDEIAGVIRNQAVWIGGTQYSPHGAIFVPPHQTLIKEYLEDLIIYANRIDVNPIIKAAVIHAQFETIHPFIDANGRTGRTLLHQSLRQDGVLQSVALPISAGLLHETDAYMTAITSFQSGDPLPIITQITKALELSINVGHQVSTQVSNIIDNWQKKIKERKTSSIWKVLYIMIEQPVINSKYLEKKLGITIRAANVLIDRLIGYGILKRTGTEQRGIFYQSDEIITVMESISNLNIMKRIY